ncbi:MAG: thrombospondin type 3 repeat-containing protein [Parcubacteria group bacterium]
MAINGGFFPADEDDKNGLDKEIVDKFYNQDFAVGGNGENFYDHLKNSRNQKIAVISVGIVGLLIVVLWFFQMKGILSVPFPPSVGSGADESVATNSAADLSKLDSSVLKQQDLDSDGLSDFDEMYIYNTSAYLADSDSDGISDGAEIKAGTDPNCPAGHTCFQNGSVAASPDNSTDNSVGAGAIGAAQLRTLLINSGKYTKAQIDQIDDKSLMDFYNNFLAENPQLKDSAQANAINSDSGATDIEATADDIRQTLLDQGMSREEVNQIDDARLMQMYREALEQAKNGSQ